MNDSEREGGARGAAQKGQPGGCFWGGRGGTPVHIMHWLQTPNKYKITTNDTTLVS